MIRAGVDKIDITPHVGIDLSGYSARTGSSVGIHDRLYAKSLVLDDGKITLIIITLDIIGISQELNRKIISRLAKKINRIY